MNLSTAKSAGRAKEVGLRKAMGSTKEKLVGQFLSESTLYAILSTVLALGVVSILLPYFNDLSGKSLMLGDLLHPGIILAILLIVLLIGVLAGTYPAFYLTSFEVAETLKGKLRTGMRSSGIRSFLVTFQFWISILLIICTAIVYQQIQFMRDRSLGFDKEKVIMVENMNRLGNNVKVMENALNASTRIAATSFSNNVLPGTNNTTIFRQEGKDDDHILGTYFVDEDYMETLGLEMEQGRFFSKDFPSDTMAVVLNESAVREFGLENPLEARILNFNFAEPTSMQVIGVIKDFNFESIKTDVRPLILLRTRQDGDNVLYVRYDGNNPGQVVNELEDIWNKLSQGDPIEFTFLNHEFDNLFKAEQRLGKLFTIFTVLAILIACLGLFGLASFIAEQRRKEIGVRKVLGASIWSIIGSMSFDFIRLVLIAFVLAIFPAWYIMDQWLKDFSFRIEISVWVFLLGGVLALLVAWLTVGYQSYQAAKANPVKSLRYE
jgi:putative ABC transport system permease protein